MLAKLSFLQTSGLILILCVLGLFPLISAIRKSASRIKGVTSGPGVWATVAARLGLAMPKPGQLALEGVLHGVDVRATVRTVDTSTPHAGDMRSKDYFTRVSATFKPPLGMSLAIVAPRGDFAAPAGSSPVSPGQADFDKSFAVSGRDPQRVEKLLLTDAGDPGDGTLLRQLTDLSRSVPRIRIDDHEVILEQTEIVQNPEALIAMLEAAVSLTTRLSHLRQG